MAVLSISLVLITSCSDDGPEGPAGQIGATGDKGDKGDGGDKGNPGNANVKSFTFVVKANDWNSGSHYGASNTHNYYQVAPTLTGNISMESNKYFVLGYAKPAGTGADYTEKKQLPYTFNVNNKYGIILELLPNRSELTISKTTNGFNYDAVPLSERPTSITYTIVMIEISSVNAIKGKVDFSNFNEVTNYFELN